MNESAVKETSFGQGQIIWNYIFLTVLFLVIILNNGLVLTAVLSQNRLKSRICIIILGSLALAQLIGGILSIPINMALVHNYQADDSLKFSRVITTFCGVASQLHLAGLSVDRCVAVLDSVWYGRWKQGCVFVQVLIAWSLSILASVLSILDFDHYSIFIVVTFFLLPLLVQVVAYGLVCCNAQRQNQTTLLRKELRLTNWFAIMMSLFHLFWLPYVITVLARDYCGSCDTTSSGLVLFVLYFQLMSLTFSSMIYHMASLDFRLAFKIILKDLGNFVCRNGEENDGIPNGGARLDGSMSTQNLRITRAANHEGLGHLNLAMSPERKGSEAQRIHRASSQAGTNGSLMAKEEVHIVPLDQARYFGQVERQEVVLGSHVQEKGTSSFDGLDFETRVKDDLAFHDIEIVPYEQSC